MKKNIHCAIINWRNIVSWLPLLLYILGNMYIVTISCPVCDAINFEINLSFLRKPFFYITKKSRRTKRVFNMKHLTIFHNFKINFWCQKLPQTQKWTFNCIIIDWIIFEFEHLWLHTLFFNKNNFIRTRASHLLKS